MAGFWVCMSDVGGHRLVGTEEQLHPAPAEVEYPKDGAAILADTAQSVPIKKYTPRDPRRRAWLWHTLPTGLAWTRYDRLIQRLQALEAAQRVTLGLSPWIFVRDQETAGLKNWLYAAGTATATTTGALTDANQSWVANAFAGGVVEITSGAAAGQRRSILSNTGTVLTLAEDFRTNPGAASYRIQALSNDWIRVRVLHVSKQPMAGGTVVQDHVRMEFVVDDPAANDRG